MLRFPVVVAPIVLSLAGACAAQTAATAPAKGALQASSSLRLVSRVVTKDGPGFHGAIYAEPTGGRLINPSAHPPFPSPLLSP